MKRKERQGLPRAERKRMKQLTIDRGVLLRETAHKIDRRLMLVKRHAPAEWLNRLTDEIHDNQRKLELVELELSDLLDRDYAARKAARG